MPDEQKAERPKIDLNPLVPKLKKIEDKTKIDVRYMLIAPYVSAHIHWDPSIGEVVYEVEEPMLGEDEKISLEKLELGMRELINVNLIVEKDLNALLDYIDKTAMLIIDELGLKISKESYMKLFYYLYRDFIGLNEIEPMLKDYFIEDIECNGVNTPVFIIHRIFRNMRTSLVYKDIEYSSRFVEKLAQRCGRYVSYASPLLDGTLPDGSRINATYTTEITSRGPTFTIRKFTKVPWTPVQLIGFNTLSPEMLAYFWILLQYKSNILIAGGTASGKTSLLNALAFFIPPEARVVSIEDSVTGDAKIIVKEKEQIKIMPIKDFVEGYKDKKAEVLTVDDSHKIKFAQPSAYIKHKVKKPIYEILTSTGRKIRVTGDHSLFSLGDNGLKEIKASDLQENKSFIAVPRSLPIEGTEIREINLINHLEAFENGFLAGDPIKKIFEAYKKDNFSVKKETYQWWKRQNIIPVREFRKINFKFNEDELQKIRIKSKNKASIPLIFPIDKEFLEFAGLWLGDGSYDSHNGNNVIISNVDEECRSIVKSIAKRLNSNISAMNDGGVSLRIHNIILYKFMKYVLKLDGYSNTKKIPPFIFGLSNEQLKAFVRGYFSADGCVKKNEVSCASQSYELLEDLQTIMLRLGIISRMNDFDRKDKCINMSISSYENIQMFKEIGFLQKRKNEKMDLMNKKAHHTCSDIVPLSIEHFKELNEHGAKLSWPYLQGMQNIGREYLQKIAPEGSFFNDISHSDVFWDKIKRIRKLPLKEIEVFDLSIPGTEKFICNNIFVHNTRELNLSRENWLPSVARTGIGVGGVGEIDMFELLKESFRQNPDYVIVGEVRGKEAYVLFQGMASGHSTLSTMHAESVETIIRRLQTPPISLPPTLVNSLDAVAVMTHAVVKKQETRRLAKVTEIIDVTPEGVAKTNTPFVWDPATDNFFFKVDSKVFEKIMMKYGLTKGEILKEFKTRTKLLFELYQRKVTDFETVQKMVNDYYKNPSAVLEKFGISE